MWECDALDSSGWRECWERDEAGEPGWWYCDWATAELPSTDMEAVRAFCPQGEAATAAPNHLAPLEGQFLHQEVNPGVHFEAMQVVGIPLKSHEQAAIGHIGRAEEKGGQR